MPGLDARPARNGGVTSSESDGALLLADSPCFNQVLKHKSKRGDAIILNVRGQSRGAIVSVSHTYPYQTREAQMLLDIILVFEHAVPK